VPADISQRLTAAEAAARTSAGAFIAAHPSPSAAQVIALSAALIPAVPDAETRAVELHRLDQIHAASSRDNSIAAHWYAIAGYPVLDGRRGANWWADQLGDFQQHEVEVLGPIEGLRAAQQGTAQLQLALHIGNELWYPSQQATHEARPFTYFRKPPAGGWQPGAFTSHPSGHATQVFAASAVMSQLWPERAREFDAVARRVAFSRLYDDMHFPHDVLVGAQVGTLAGELATKIAVPNVE